MNATQTTALRNLWSDATATAVPAPTYRLLDGRGRVVMFGITQERAESYLLHYTGGRIVPLTLHHTAPPAPETRDDPHTAEPV